MCGAGTVEVEYTFDYPSVKECPPKTNSHASPIKVTIPVNGTALNVMEASVDVSPAYRFTATYFGSTLGYYINTINGTAASDTCYWEFFYQVPGSLQPVSSDVGVSNYTIPTDGYSIIMQYNPLNESNISHLLRLI